jgi:hypothetical protein
VPRRSPRRSPRTAEHVRCPATLGPPAGGLSFGLIHPRTGPFTNDRVPPLRAGQERWRTVVNSAAKYSKACEGASLPWVQIPPPPLLTCKNTSPGSRPAGVPCSPGLIWWAQFWATCGSAARLSRGCCAWSPRPGTGLNAGERGYARPRSVRRAVQGRPGPSATSRIPANSQTASHSDPEVLENAFRAAAMNAASGRLAGCARRTRMVDLCRLPAVVRAGAEMTWPRLRALGLGQFDGYVGGLAEGVVHSAV